MIKYIAATILFSTSAVACPCPAETPDGVVNTFAALEASTAKHPKGTFKLLGDCVVGQYENKLEKIDKQWQALNMPPSNYVPNDPRNAGVYNGKLVNTLDDEKNKFMRSISIFKFPIKGYFDGQKHTVFGNGQYGIGFYYVEGTLINMEIDLVTKASCDKPNS